MNSPTINFLAGASLGALVALLTGLSASPVVASLVALLASGAMVFLAISDKVPVVGTDSLSNDVLYRIIGFCIAGSLFLIIGIEYRNSSKQLPHPIVDAHTALLSIGIKEPTAQRLAIELTKTDGKVPKSEKERLLNSKVLFSGLTNLQSCAELDPRKFSDMNSMRTRYSAEGKPWVDVLNAYDAVKSSEANLEPNSYFLGSYLAYCGG